MKVLSMSSEVWKLTICLRTEAKLIATYLSSKFMGTSQVRETAVYCVRPFLINLVANFYIYRKVL